MRCVYFSILEKTDTARCCWCNQVRSQQSAAGEARSRSTTREGFAASVKSASWKAACSDSGFARYGKMKSLFTPIQIMYFGRGTRSKQTIAAGSIDVSCSGVRASWSATAVGVSSTQATR